MDSSGNFIFVGNFAQKEQIKFNFSLKLKLVMSHKFVLEEIVFDNKSWRKLSGLTIPIARRLTVIAGHNGIGKSSILGFIANSAGLEYDSNDDPIKSYFNQPFISQFQEQFRLTDTDISTDSKDKGFINLNFSVDNGRGHIKKKFKIGTAKSGEGNLRFRVVPRTEGGKKLFGVGPAQKIQCPTIFISASRVWPLGESVGIAISKVENIHPNDAHLIKSIHDALVPHQTSGNDDIQKLSISIDDKRRQKLSAFPSLTYDVSAISLGQGSIGTIATALASFQKLKRELKDEYKGGILVIDEIEAGLHPYAQCKLVEILSKQAQELELQIIATTHSLTILEVVHSRINPKKQLNSIVYIQDTLEPVVKTNMSIDEMYDEMRLPQTALLHARKPAVYVYTEDQCALDVLEGLLEEFKKTEKYDESKLPSVLVRKSPLSLGASQMLSLLRDKRMHHFRKEALCIFDGDQKPVEKPSDCHHLCLPCISGALNPPESELADFVRRAQKDSTGPEASALRDKKLTSDRMASIQPPPRGPKGFPKPGDEIEKEKKWFSKLTEKNKKGIISAWASCSCNQEEIEAFVRSYFESLRKIRKAVLYLPRSQSEN